MIPANDIQKMKDSYYKSEFSKRFYDFEKASPKIDIKDIIATSIRERDSNAFSMAMDLGFHFKFFEEESKANDTERNEICSMIGYTIEQYWHNEHENIVEVLQMMHSPAAVEPLRRAVFTKPPLLVETDDADGLSRKAIWGLGKLILPVRGGPVDAAARKAAFQELTKLANHPDTVVAARANEQLERFAASGLDLSA